MWFEFKVLDNPVSEINQDLFRAWCSDRKISIKNLDDLRCAVKVYTSGVQDYLIDAFHLDADIDKEIDRMKTNEVDDVVKVVRCEDCIYSNHWYGDHQLCTFWSESGIGVFNDGFCNYGKIEEDHND